MPGAESDCARVVVFLENNAEKIDDIYMTMDCHQFFHIANSSFWKSADGNEIPVNTTITHADFLSGKYTPVIDTLRPRVEDYLLSLESLGRYQLTIWPPHCLIGSWGFSIQQDVWNAVNKWEQRFPGKSVNFIVKSRNPLTEHYSAIRTEVSDPFDATTKTNFALIDNLKKADKIFVAGESLSHSVANTLRDLFIYIIPQRFALLTDCSTTLQIYGKNALNFIESSREIGMTTATSDLIL